MTTSWTFSVIYVERCSTEQPVGGCPQVRTGLLDFSVGQRLQFFDDLFQPSAALGVVLLGWQSTSLLGVLLVESLDVTDLGL
jgi:hypothetical protein